LRVGGPGPRILTERAEPGRMETELLSRIRYSGKGATRMTERKSPTAVLREGPRALSDAQVREIEDSSLAEVLNVDIDDVIEYVHKDLRSLPDFTTQY